MDLRAFPVRVAGEPLIDYLRRSLDSDDVSIGTLARHLDMQRVALYKIKNGGGADLRTLTRFGALVGAMKRDKETLALMDALGLRADAEKGWETRAKVLRE